MKAEQACKLFESSLINNENPKMKILLPNKASHEKITISNSTIFQ